MANNAGANTVRPNTTMARTGNGLRDVLTERGLPAAFALVVATAMIHPRGLPAAIALLALVLAGVAWLWRDQLRFEPRGATEANLLTNVWREQPATIAFLAFAAYCAVTALWSPVTARRWARSLGSSCSS